MQSPHRHPRAGSKCILTTLIAIALSGLAVADVIHVPADYPTIQQAIDAAAQSGDEIIVAPGTYNEAINLLGKEVYLHSSDGRDVTTIDGTDLDSSVIICMNGESADAIIEGFTVTEGLGYPIAYAKRAGGGLFVSQSSPTVEGASSNAMSFRRLSQDMEAAPTAR